MKTALILLVVMVAFAAARTLGDKKSVKGLPNLPCRSQNVGKKYTYKFSPHKYLECTRRGLELKRCDEGTWFEVDAQGCIGDEESSEEDDGCAPAPEESVEVPEPESEEPELEPEHSASSESAEVEPEHPSSEEVVPAPESSSSEESGEVEPTDAPAPEEPSSEEVVPAPESSSSSEEVVPAPESSSEEQEPVPESSSSEEGSCDVVCSYHGEYLVNPESCHSFYQCSWGVAHLHQCPLMDDAGNQLVFNPNLDVCDWPRDYKCKGKPGCAAPGPEPGCPAVSCDYHGQYHANPADCHSFYQCSWGVAYLHQCAMENQSSRLVFNPELNVCVWNADYECNNSCKAGITA